MFRWYFLLLAAPLGIMLPEEIIVWGVVSSTLLRAAYSVPTRRFCPGLHGQLREDTNQLQSKCMYIGAHEKSDSKIVPDTFEGKI